MKALLGVTMLVVVAIVALSATLFEAPAQRAPSSEVARSPALPLPRTQDVEQGDPCPRFGLTTANRDGQAFDCEPWDGSGVNRWIIP
jgi:hypothetical protein